MERESRRKPPRGREPGVGRKPYAAPTLTKEALQDRTGTHKNPFFLESTTAYRYEPPR
jgi:hypothetical protein